MGSTTAENDRRRQSTLYFLFLPDDVRVVDCLIAEKTETEYVLPSFLAYSRLLGCGYSSVCGTADNR